MLTGSVQRSYYVLLRSSQTFYRLLFKKDRFAWITDAWLPSVKRRLEQTDLVRLNAFNDRWMKNTGTPNAYGQIGADVFYTWPTPSSEIVVDLRCVVIPARYSEGTDRVKDRDIFREAAINYAVSEYYASIGDAKSAVDCLNRYIELLGVQGLYTKTYDRSWGYKTEQQSKAVTE